MNVKFTMKNIVLIGFFVTATVLLMDCTNNFPGVSVLRKIKYIYLVILIVDFIRSQRKQVSKSSCFVVLLLFIHTIVFGVFFINPSVINLTTVHCREMIIYLLLLGFLTNAIERYNCKLKFIELTCLSFGIFMIWTGITHFFDFVNPIYYIFVFIRDLRIRSNFGTPQFNYMGYYCFIALVFYYAMWYEYERLGKLDRKIKYCLLGITVWTCLILFSTGSRSSILSIMIFVMLCLYFKTRKNISGRKRYGIILAAICLGIIFICFFGGTIWANANRDSNISINMPVFHEMKAYWTGMGYIESAGFYNDAYGYDTWPVDIYYIYIFLSTGFIGMLIISSVLIYLICKLLVSKNNFIKKVVFPAYVAVLFDGLWQVNIFTYRYIATLFIGVLLLVSISVQNKEIGDINL